MERKEAYLYVTGIRSRDNGSALFSGYEVNHKGDIVNSKKLLVANATSKVLGHTVYPGQVWHLIGQPYKYTRENNGFKIKEDQINVFEATLHSGAGDNFIAFISGNDAFKGIGTTKARQLWIRFGKKVYSIISSGDVATLREVLSKKSAELLVSQWKEVGQYASLVWLDKRGIPSDIGSKVIEYYGYKTRDKIEEDPYRLVAFCASWKRVDTIALHQLEVSTDDDRRLSGAIEEALYSAYSSKHTAITESDLKVRIKARLIPVNEQGEKLDTFANRAMANKLAAKALEKDLGFGAYYKSKDLYHPTGAYLMEQFIAEKLNEFKSSDMGSDINLSEVEGLIEEFEEIHKSDLPSGLTKAQREAVMTSVYTPFLLISGGAGTGKTTLLKCIYYVLDKYVDTTMQMALAGRAAKRMQEATGREAFTIAGFLKIYEEDPDKLEPLSCIVVDESSMVDLFLAYRILKTIPDGCRLIMVGDEKQLAPVGPGLVFHLLVESDDVEHIKLTETKRQKDSTGIPTIANAIRRHEWPDLFEYEGKEVGVSFVECEPSVLTEVVLDVYAEIGGATEDVRIIAPTKDHPSGVKALNRQVFETYRSEDEPVTYWDERHQATAVLKYRMNDQVMWLKNDYARDLRNGSLGVITKILDGEDGKYCTVDFEGIVVDLTLEDMSRETLAHSYAITCHKAQGSQFDRVIVPIYHWAMMDQSWLYTAVTRGVKQVVFCGDMNQAKLAALAPSTAMNRSVGLGMMLENAFKPDKAA